jgi:hypothetical protein
MPCLTEKQLLPHLFHRGIRLHFGPRMIVMLVWSKEKHPPTKLDTALVAKKEAHHYG